MQSGLAGRVGQGPGEQRLSVRRPRQPGQRAVDSPRPWAPPSPAHCNTARCARIGVSSCRRKASACTTLTLASGGTTGSTRRSTPETDWVSTCVNIFARQSAGGSATIKAVRRNTWRRAPWPATARPHFAWRNVVWPEPYTFVATGNVLIEIMLVSGTLEVACGWLGQPCDTHLCRRLVIRDLRAAAGDGLDRRERRHRQLSASCAPPSGCWWWRSDGAAARSTWAPTTSKPTPSASPAVTRCAKPI